MAVQPSKIANTSSPIISTDSVSTTADAASLLVVSFISISHPFPIKCSPLNFTDNFSPLISILDPSTVAKDNIPTNSPPPETNKFFCNSIIIIPVSFKFIQLPIIFSFFPDTKLRNVLLEPIPSLESPSPHNLPSITSRNSFSASASASTS